MKAKLLVSLPRGGLEGKINKFLSEECPERMEHVSFACTPEGRFAVLILYEEKAAKKPKGEGEVRAHVSRAR